MTCSRNATSATLMKVSRFLTPRNPINYCCVIPLTPEHSLIALVASTFSLSTTAHISYLSIPIAAQLCFAHPHRPSTSFLLSGDQRLHLQPRVALSCTSVKTSRPTSSGSLQSLLLQEYKLRFLPKARGRVERGASESKGSRDGQAA